MCVVDVCKYVLRVLSVIAAAATALSSFHCVLLDVVLNGGRCIFAVVIVLCWSRRFMKVGASWQLLRMIFIMHLVFGVDDEEAPITHARIDHVAQPRAFRFIGCFFF